MDIIKKPIRSLPRATWIGLAAEDLKENTVILEVIIPELTPNTISGTLGAGITEGQVNLKDRDGNIINAPYTTTNHLIATWEGESNLRYPPRVRKGEPVEVYQNTNQDKYYWKTTGQGRDFRTTDRIYVEIGASDPTKPGQTKDDTNTYSAYLDSDRKIVGFKTSKKNGEACAFSCEANVELGTFHISDDSEDPGNRIFLDTGTKSGIPAFHVNLSSGITFKMEGENLFVKIPGKFEIDCGDRFIINSPLTVFNLNQTGSILINCSNIAFNIAKDFVIAAGSVMGINVPSLKIGGTLIAQAIRSNTIVKGALGTLYKGISIKRPQETPVINTSNNTDTDTSGISYTTN